MNNQMALDVKTPCQDSLSKAGQLFATSFALLVVTLYRKSICPN